MGVEVYALNQTKITIRCMQIWMCENIRLRDKGRYRNLELTIFLRESHLSVACSDTHIGRSTCSRTDVKLILILVWLLNQFNLVSLFRYRKEVHLDDYSYQFRDILVNHLKLQSIHSQFNYRTLPLMHVFSGM